MPGRKQQSPAWKNPRERMTKHMKRKSSSRCLNTSLNSFAVSQEINTESCPPVLSPPRSTTKNPFKKVSSSPQQKRSKVDEDEDLKEFSFDFDDTTANDSFSSAVIAPICHPQLNKVKRSSFSRSQSMKSPRSQNECPLDFSAMDMDIFSPNTSLNSSCTAPEVCERTSTQIPLDLRLGTKLRITSKKPFPWIKNVSSTGTCLVRITGEDKNEGMNMFLSFDHHRELPPPASVCSLVEASTLYWQFPSLPWISLFPRFEPLLKSQPKLTAPPMAPSMIEVMCRQWSECFEQIYLSWKKGDRLRFYVSCPTFTVLFTKSREDLNLEEGDDSFSCFQTSDGSQHMAIITPTNAGFRRFLKEEGVEFEICNSKKRRLSKVSFKLDVDSLDGDISLMSNDSEKESGSGDGEKSRRTSFDLDEPMKSVDTEKENENAEDNDSEPDESPSKKAPHHDWLHEMGVSPRNTLKLRKHKSMTTSTTDSVKKAKDEDETSSVVIRGSFVQALYNLLQTSRVCRAIAGPHANLPPTLLAAKPFLYGQMMSLKKTSQSVKRQGHAMEYVLELDGGPVMPHSVALAVEFVRRANLCADAPVQLRVNDRNACSGLNGPDNADEWKDITVTDTEIKWNP